MVMPCTPYSAHRSSWTYPYLTSYIVVLRWASIFYVLYFSGQYCQVMLTCKISFDGSRIHFWIRYVWMRDLYSNNISVVTVLVQEFCQPFLCYSCSNMVHCWNIFEGICNHERSWVSTHRYFQKTYFTSWSFQVRYNNNCCHASFQVLLQHILWAWIHHTVITQTYKYFRCSKLQWSLWGSN